MIALYTMLFQRPNLTGLTLKSAVLLVSSVSFFVLAVGCAGKEEPSEERIVATVNGEAITGNELNRELLRIDKNFSVKASEPGDTRLEQEVLHQLIRRRLLLQESRKRGIELKPEQARKVVSDQKGELVTEDLERMLQKAGISYDEWEKRNIEDRVIEILIEQVIDPGIQIPEEDLTGYYQNHLEELQVEDRVRVRQIVLSNKEEARKVRKRLTDGQEDFALVASEVSLSPDAEQGGDIGTFSQGQMPPEFDKVCFSLQIGEISQVVKSPYGYHIFRVEERLAAGIVPFYEARETIQGKLFSKRREQALLNYQEELWNRAEISTFLERD